MGPDLGGAGDPPLRRDEEGRDVRRRHAAADRLRARSTSATSSATRRRTSSRATSACGGRTSSTRWAGTTTASRPSGASRTTSTSAASRTSPYEPGLKLAMADDAARKQPAAPRLARELHRALPRAHRRGREGVQGALAPARRSRSTGASSTRRSTSTRAAPRSGASSTSSARATSTRSRRRRCGTSTSRPRSRRPRSRTARSAAPSTTSRFGVEGGGSFVIATTRPELLPGVRRRDRAPRRRALQAALRQAGRHAALPRAGADLPERARRPREGHRHPDGLHLRRRDRRAVVARAAAGAAAGRRPRRPPRARALRRRGLGEPRRDGGDRARTASSWASRCARRRRGSSSCCATPRPRPPATARRRSPPSRGRSSTRSSSTRRATARSSSSPRGSGSCASSSTSRRSSRRGERVSWHPDFMRLRFRNWTENLNLDWCISRQRYFGVPFPLWYSVAKDGSTDFSKPLVADEKDLPVDPVTAAPPGYREEQRDQPGGFRGGGGRLRHLVHVLADAADQRRAGSAARAARAPLPDGRAAAEPRDHPHLGLLHDREGAPPREDDPLAPRRHLRLGARPRPQEDVEEQGQRDHARCTCSTSTAPTRSATGRSPRGSGPTPPSTRRC